MEFRSIHGTTHGVLHLHKECLVILRQCFIGVQFIGGIVLCCDLPPYMILLLCEVLDDQTVLADKAIDQRLNLQTAKPDLAVGHDKARLYHIANADLGFQFLIDDLQIEVRFRDLTAHNRCVLHLLNHGQHRRAEFQII